MRHDLSWTPVILVLASLACGQGASGDASVASQQAIVGNFEVALPGLGGQPAIVKADEGDGEKGDGEEGGGEKSDGEEGDGEEGDGEEGDGEEGEEGGKGDVGISIMLLGSIAFMMSLFYVTKARDPDFKVYAWEIISKTISIFSAVLIFQATQSVPLYLFLGKGVAEEGEEEEVSEEEEQTMMRGELLVALMMMAFWYTLLQFTLAYLSGAVEVALKPDKEGTTLSLQEEEKVEEKEVNLKCFGVLIGHVTGFAAINALGVVQQMWSSEESLYVESEDMRHVASFGVCAFAFLVLMVVHKVTDFVRGKVAMGDDGMIDESEKVWQEETTEVEDDVVGLAISFLFVQAVRFLVGGSLPNVEGEDEDTHGSRQIVTLFMIGMAMMILLLLKAQFLPVTDPRKNAQFSNIVSMSFAWCLYFSVYWLTAAMLSNIADGMLEDVVIALIVTAAGLGLIAVADKFADADWTAPEIDTVIRGEFVTSIGMLIGFSWEKNFDKAVTCIALSAHAKSHPGLPVFTKLVMSIFCVGLTVPAWWLHILPRQLKRMAFSARRKAVSKLNYMIKFPHKYHDWPYDIDKLPSGVKEPLIKAEEHGGHGGGHQVERSFEQPKRRIMQENWHGAEMLGRFMLDVDGKRHMWNQEFQCLVSGGDCHCKFDKEKNEWYVVEAQDRLLELEQEFKRFAEDKKQLYQIIEEQKQLLEQGGPGGRVQEVEEHNKRLQQHIDEYGHDIEELKHLSEQLLSIYHDRC